MKQNTMAIENTELSTSRTRVLSWAAMYEGRKYDAEQALARLLTPAVLKDLPTPLQGVGTVGSHTEWINARLAESTVLAIASPDKATLFGLILLADFAIADAGLDIHLGYLFAQDHWGKGLASEVIQALTDHLLYSDLDIRLFGSVDKSNPASARVLQKAGFLHDAMLSDDDTDMFIRT